MKQNSFISPKLFKALFSLALILSGFLVQAQSSTNLQENVPVEKQKNKYVVKTEALHNNFWGYIISENGKTIFRSSESNLHPNVFSSEKEAFAAAEIKIKQLESQK